MTNITAHGIVTMMQELFQKLRPSMVVVVSQNNEKGHYDTIKRCATGFGGSCI